MSPLAPYQETAEQRRERVRQMILKNARSTNSQQPQQQPQQQPDELEPGERDEYVEGDWLSDYGSDTSWKHFVPLYGGYLEAKSIWNEEVSLKQQFKDHPFITSLRLTGVALDFLPVFGVPGALARGGARMAFRQAVIGGAKFRSRPFRWIMDSIQYRPVWVGGKGGKYIKRVGIPPGERAKLREAALNARLTDDPGEQLVLLVGDSSKMTDEQAAKALEVLQKIYKPTATGRAIQKIIQTGEATSGELKLLDAEAELRLAVQEVAVKVGGQEAGELSGKQAAAFQAIRPRIVQALESLPPGEEKRRKVLQGLLDNIPKTESPKASKFAADEAASALEGVYTVERKTVLKAATEAGEELDEINEAARIIGQEYRAGNLTAAEASEQLAKARTAAARAAYKDAIDKGLTKEAATKASRKAAAEFGSTGTQKAATEEIPKTGTEYVWGEFRADTSHPWVRSGLLDEHRIADDSLKVLGSAASQTGRRGALHTIGQWFPVTQDAKGAEPIQYGWKAYFDTPSLPGRVGRRGTAVIWDMGEELGERRFVPQLIIGSDKTLLEASATLNGAKQIFVEAGMKGSEVQARAFGHTLRHYMGFPAQSLMSRAGRLWSRRSQQAINRLPNTEGDVLLRELAPTEWSRQTIGRAQENAHTLNNLKARLRSLESGSKEATDLARLHLQDEAVEVAHFLYRMWTDDVYKGVGIAGGKQWLKKNWKGNLVVKDKELDKEIFNFMDQPDKYADKVSEQAKLIGGQLKILYKTIGLELKAVSDNPVIQKMSLIENYITHITDDAQRNLFGMYSRSNRVGGNQNVPMHQYFGFASRTSAIAAGEQSAWESVSLYMKTAISVKHGEAAMDKLRLMRRAAIEEGDIGGGWSINQVMAIITGEGHDAIWQDAAGYAALVDMLQGPRLAAAFSRAVPYVDKLRWWRSQSGTVSRKRQDLEKAILNMNGRMTQNLYRGLLYGRLPTAIDQFTQFNHTIADIGVRNTIRGISVLGRKMFTKTSVGQGLRETLVETPAYTFGGGVVGGAVGFVAAGPLGAMVGAAVTPVARFIKSQVKGTFANLRQPVDVMRRASIQDPARILRGPEYVKATGGLFAYLDEIGFTQIDTAEAILRGASLYGGVDAALKLGFRGRMALEFAVGVVEKTQFTYDQLSRNPWFRQTVHGQWFAPLSSFPMKQMRFVNRLLREGGSDGASPMVAMTRYLFFNGLFASIFRESAKAMVGEPMVPRAMQSRIEPGFLGPLKPQTGFKAPPGFEAMAGFNMTRMPGPTLVNALYEVLQEDEDAAHFWDAFMKAFMPFGLVFNDAFRTRSRMRMGKTFRKEGLYTQGGAWLRTRGSFDMSEGLQAGIERELDLFTPAGGAVRELSPEKMAITEYGRMLGFVSEAEQAQMDRERLLGAFGRSYVGADLNEKMNQLFRGASYGQMRPEQLVGSIRELLQSEPSMLRIWGAGWDRDAVSDLERPRAMRLWEETLTETHRNMIKAYSGIQAMHERNPNAGYGEVMEIFEELASRSNMPKSDLVMWVSFYRSLGEEEIAKIRRQFREMLEERNR